MPTLCTTAEAATITGHTVTESQVAKAHYDMQIACNRLFIRLDEGVLSDDDADWLQLAVAHQAVWVRDHPESDRSIDVTSASEAGESLSPTEDGLYFSPLAVRTLRNLSWVRSRTIPVGRTPTVVRGAEDSATSDLSYAPWGDRS